MSPFYALAICSVLGFIVGVLAGNFFRAMRELRFKEEAPTLEELVLNKDCKIKITEVYSSGYDAGLRVGDVLYLDKGKEILHSPALGEYELKLVMFYVETQNPLTTLTDEDILESLYKDCEVEEFRSAILHVVKTVDLDELKLIPAMSPYRDHMSYLNYKLYQNDRLYSNSTLVVEIPGIYSEVKRVIDQREQQVLDQNRSQAKQEFINCLKGE